MEQRDLRSLGWVVIALLVGLALLFKGGFSHYTWWSVSEFFVTALLATFNEDHRVAVLFLTQSLFVIIGVTSMSWMGCSMLKDTAAELSWSYLPLNFIIHYGLFVAVFLNPPLKEIKNYHHQVVAGASLFVTYSLLNDPTLVYGCNLPRGLVPSVFVVLTLLLCNDWFESQAVYYLGGYRKHK